MPGTNVNKDLRVKLAWIDDIASPWSCPKYLDPDSEGPFAEADVRWNTGLDCYEVYFDDGWWDQASFLMGRISALREQHKKEISMAVSPKQKHTIESLMKEAVAFPPRWEQPDGAITVLVPTGFAGRHGLPESIDADLVTIDKEGGVIRRFSVTYKGVMQADEVIKLLETGWFYG